MASGGNTEQTEGSTEDLIALAFKNGPRNLHRDNAEKKIYLLCCAGPGNLRDENSPVCGANTSTQGKDGDVPDMDITTLKYHINAKHREWVKRRLEVSYDNKGRPSKSLDDATVFEWCKGDPLTMEEVKAIANRDVANMPARALKKISQGMFFTCLPVYSLLTCSTDAKTSRQSAPEASAQSERKASAFLDMIALKPSDPRRRSYPTTLGSSAVLPTKVNARLFWTTYASQLASKKQRISDGAPDFAANKENELYMDSDDDETLPTGDDDMSLEDTQAGKRKMR